MKDGFTTSSESICSPTIRGGTSTYGLIELIANKTNDLARVAETLRSRILGPRPEGSSPPNPTTNCVRVVLEEACRSIHQTSEILGELGKEFSSS